MSLRIDLAELAAAARSKRDPQRQALIDLSVERVRSSGAVQSALRVGEMAPDFELPDAEGMRFSLMAALDQGPVVLLFYRGSWCPYCRLALSAYDRALPAFAAAGAQVVAISAELPGAAEVRARFAGLTLRRLFDFDHRVARLFDLIFPMPPELVSFSQAAGLDVATIGSSGRWELPLPATYLIGRDGNVAFAHVEADFTQRAEPADVLAALGRLGTREPAAD